jgi:PLD-like domain
MLGKDNHGSREQFLGELHPIAEQAASVVAYLGDRPDAFSRTDQELAAKIGRVSAQQVAFVRRALVQAGFARTDNFSGKLVLGKEALHHLSANLEGIACYLRVHRDADTVSLVLTEPGENSALRSEINRRGLPPRLFQTRDAFLNLAQSAERRLTILAPFIDDEGAEFLVQLFSICRHGVDLRLVCRPLVEEHCGPSFRRRKSDFHRLGVTAYEYALLSPLPSRRETFHAKVILVDDSAYYAGSSNFMKSALDRSLECGVIVRGRSAHELYGVVEALISVASRVDAAVW